MAFLCLISGACWTCWSTCPSLARPPSSPPTGIDGGSAWLTGIDLQQQHSHQTAASASLPASNAAATWANIVPIGMGSSPPPPLPLYDLCVLNELCQGARWSLYPAAGRHCLNLRCHRPQRRSQAASSATQLPPRAPLPLILAPLPVTRHEPSLPESEPPESLLVPSPPVRYPIESWGGGIWFLALDPMMIGYCYWSCYPDDVFLYQHVRRASLPL
jgi:hypothetical protein